MSIRKAVPGLALAALTVAAAALTSGASAAGAPGGKTAKGAAAKFDQAAAIKELEKEIAGKENQPAEGVFMDVQLLKDVPAERLLKIMEFGYSRSLGVTCVYCHVPGQWQSDDKKEKGIARAMIRLNGTINDELKKIGDLKPEGAVVNCTTCHRGQTKPALSLK